MIGRMKKIAAALITCCCLSGHAHNKAIDWERFMQNHDLVFDRLTANWHEGLFTGNGLLGTMLYLKDSSTLRIDIGRTDVHDHQPDSIDPLFGKARLPLGYFTLRPAGSIRKVESRLDLWNAEVRATVTTDKGSITLRMLTAATDEVIVVETSASGEEDGFIWEWNPEKAISPRAATREVPQGYLANPDPVLTNLGVMCYCSQELAAGGGYTVAWEKERDWFFITAKYDTENIDNTVLAILKQLNEINPLTVDDVVKQHRDWWHGYYPQSFMAMADARMEQFYWIQQYKLASATRAGNLPIDLMGPWMRATPWPIYWMNLNIQLTYSPLYTANRLDLASTLTDFIDRNADNLAMNVPEPYRYNSAAIGRTAGVDMKWPVPVTKEGTERLPDADAEVGNLTWILHSYWQQYRYSMDPRLLEKFYPLLKRSVNYYIHLMDRNEQGQWEIVPRTYSPEYPGGMGHNTNYDLSLLRWGVNTLLRIDEQEGYNDPQAEQWRDIAENLIPYPQDSTGLMIARGIPYAQSHRHYSHLLMIYPLYEMNWDQPENRALIERSLDHWQSMPAALQGYSFTGRASINAMMGRGDQAYGALKTLLDRFVKPNTMYLETGPVIETPLAAAASIQELYLQYWNNTVRVFPAVPSHWPDAAFDNFRTEGAFLVSAVRKDGVTRWVRVKSTVGGELRIRPNLPGRVKIKSKGIGLKYEGDGVYSCSMPKDAEITLYSDKSALKIPVAPVAYHNPE